MYQWILNGYIFDSLVDSNKRLRCLMMSWCAHASDRLPDIISYLSIPSRKKGERERERKRERDSVNWSLVGLCVIVRICYDQDSVENKSQCFKSDNFDRLSNKRGNAMG